MTKRIVSASAMTTPAASTGVLSRRIVDLGLAHLFEFVVANERFSPDLHFCSPFGIGGL
jgi:hypothetical protein